MSTEDRRTVNMVHYPNKDASDPNALDEYLDAIPVDAIDATGTPSSSTYLRGDGAWSTVAGSGGGDVSKVGTPVDNQVGVWTGDGTLEGTSGLTYDGSAFGVTGNITATGTANASVVSSGVADTTQGVVQVFGGSGDGEGGIVDIYNDAVNDGTNEYWRLFADGNGDLQMGNNNTTNMFVLTSDDEIATTVRTTMALGTIAEDALFGQTSALRIRDVFSEAGSGTDGSANECALMVQVTSDTTSSAADYQKNAAAFWNIQVDPSDTGTPIARDSVGCDMRGYIANTNATGRVWGGYAEGRIVGGGTGDGQAIGIEILMANEGTEQATLETNTQKVGLLLVGNGTNPCTAAIYITNSASSGAWRKGVIVDTTAIENSSDITFGHSDASFEIARTGAVGCLSIAAQTAEISNGFTVAGLPAGVAGAIARVTDASSPSVGSTVTGGGAAAALVWYNGSNWTVIGV